MLRAAFRRLPPATRQRVVRGLRPVRWGNLRRAEPFSRRFGFDRGTPVDRYYMEQFLAREAHAIRGVVGEIAEPHYARRFGGRGVERVEVIDMDPANGEATIIADVAKPDALPHQAFDCLIVTQTLQYVAQPDVALTHLRTALRRGGTLLLAVPALAAHDARERDEDDYWRFWPPGLGRLLAHAFPHASYVVSGYGNLLSATAFLHGISAEELTSRELGPYDARYPVVLCARVDVPAEVPPLSPGQDPV